MAKLIEATYGDALFELAVEESRVDSLYDEAGAVIEAFNDNPEFGRLLNHPEVEKGEKEGLINNIFSVCFRRYDRFVDNHGLKGQTEKDC